MANNLTKYFRIDNILPFKDDIDGRIYLYLYVSDVNGGPNDQYGFKVDYNKHFFYINLFEVQIKKSYNKQKIAKKVIDKLMSIVIADNDNSNFCPLCGNYLYRINSNNEISFHCVNIKCIDMKNHRQAIYNKMKITNIAFTDDLINYVINLLNDLNFSSNKFQFDISQLVRRIKADYDLNFFDSEKNKQECALFLNSFYNLNLNQFFRLCGIPYIYESSIVSFCNSLDNDLYKFAETCDYIISTNNPATNSIPNPVAGYIKLVTLNNRDIIKFFKLLKDEIK